MKPKLVIRGSQDQVNMTIDRGGSVSEELFYQHSPLRAILVQNGQEIDQTDELMHVDLSPLTDIEHSGNFDIPWRVVYKDKLLQDGTVRVQVLVQEPKVIITDYQVKDDGFQILLNKGVSIPKGYRNLPGLAWSIAFPGYEVDKLEVFFVNNEQKIMQVDYSQSFKTSITRGEFEATYTGAPVLFDGVNRAGIAYILTLIAEEEKYDHDDEGIYDSGESAFAPSLEEGESKVNQVLDNLVNGLSDFKDRLVNREKKVVSQVKDKKNDTPGSKQAPTSRPQTNQGQKKGQTPKRSTDQGAKKEVQAKGKKKGKGVKRIITEIVLTVLLTLIIGFTGLFAMNQYKEKTLATVQDDVSVIMTNQEASLSILNHETLSNEDIAQLDKLLNQNQQMINAMDSKNIFISKKRTELARSNNDLVKEAKAKFDQQIEEGEANE